MIDMLAMDSQTATPAKVADPETDPLVVALRAAISGTPAPVPMPTPAQPAAQPVAMPTVVETPEQPVAMPIMAMPSAPPAPAPAPVTETVATVVTQTVTVQPVAARSDLTKAESEWGWMELRDYVVNQIETRFGVFPRNAKKEYGIFNRYFTAYGADAIAVAKAAFEIHDGWWNSAPIRIERFCKGSDIYFHDKILAEISATA